MVATGTLCRFVYVMIMMMEFEAGIAEAVSISAQVKHAQAATFSIAIETSEKVALPEAGDHKDPTYQTATV